ncbi:hypothetical protein WH47_06008 [Habropoda laboriosa]|uniref:Histone-lysine N-methyltransferase SETMAR n=1 Tax=Habropoda laboriosa TaxID=597456 RepID=A0A0L7REV6_9HYME|nr:hypothetical protein WH47_06008 [Habropoda laboriosa]
MIDNCHSKSATILQERVRIIETCYKNWRFSRSSDVNWPPRLCDLTPLDHFLRGYVKSV